MDLFAGCIRLSGGPLDQRFEDQIRRAAGLPTVPRPVVQRTVGAVIAQSPPDASQTRAGESGAFAACARLDNRAELAEALGLSASRLAQTSDTALLQRMFAQWGGDGVARCLGAFAFAHWDAAARRLTLGRDCLGHRSMFFHRAGDHVYFASSLAALLRMPDVPRVVDEVAIADFLVNNRRDPHRTAYRGIERVSSRTLVTVDRSGMRRSYYWSPDLDARLPYARDDEYVERARELFDEAVLAATAGFGEVAIALSGGLDSSAIAATVARQGRAGRIACYTTVPPSDAAVEVGPRRYRDERAKVEALGRMYPALDLNFMTLDGAHVFADDPSRYFDEALLPRRGAQNLGTVAAFTDILSRHRLVLFGTSGNFGLTWTGEYSLLALVRRGEWARFARELPLVLRRSHDGPARALVSNLIKPATPVALRRAWRRMSGRDPDSVAYYSALNPEFIADNNLLRRWREQSFEPWFDQNGWQPAKLRAWHLFDRASIDRDNDWAGRTRGLEVRDPFADRRLLEFALAVPEPLYRRDGVPRSFARAIFADRLPREILQETRRGAGNLDWMSKLARSKPRFSAELERLEASPAARRLIDLPRLKRLLDEWPDDDAGLRRRFVEYNSMLPRAIHAGAFIRWVEGRND